MIYSILIIIAVAGCTKDDYDKLSAADQEAFEGMEQASNKAQLYNDSLVYCDETSAPCSQAYIEHYDSMLHYYVNQWNYYHNNYNHDNGHCDHYHDGSGMHHHGHHNNHNNDEGHYEYHHEMMDELINDHEPHHP